ncbi:MAG: heparan-alpha-glucosaminide N-acetyltransferase [Candidatus Gracilibacteria bacterium]
MTTTHTHRLPFPDTLRGLAVLGMIVFHVFFILNYFQISPNDMYAGPWLVLGQFVRFIFIGLVGVSLYLSNSPYNKQFFRGLKILLCAALISLVTYFFAPDEFVRFGILHLIGVGVILLSPFANSRRLSLTLGLLSLVMTKFLPNFPYLPGLDYFPIFPWISLIFFGIFLGPFFKKINLRLPLVDFLGRHSLLIYMIHIPIIIGTLIVFQILPFYALWNS